MFMMTTTLAILHYLRGVVWRFYVDTTSHSSWGVHHKWMLQLEEENILQFYPYKLLEGKQHLGGEDCNVPKFYGTLNTFVFAVGGE